MPVIVGAGHDLIAKIAADELRSSRTLDWRGVDIRDYSGYVGDGVNDDTAAFIAALEDANGVAAGTWATGGDVYASGTPTRSRSPLLLPPDSITLLTAPIPIRFNGVIIRGSNVRRVRDDCRIRFAAANGFQIDATFAVANFTLKDLVLEQQVATYGLTGTGVAMTGAEFQIGLILDAVNIRYWNKGLYIAPTGKTDGTGVISSVVVDGCIFHDNMTAIDVPGILYNSGITDSTIAGNYLAGVLCGGQNFWVTGCDLEGEPRPLEISHGTNNRAVTVQNNRFESITFPYPRDPPYTGTHAAIVLGLAHGFDIRNNSYSSGVDCPHVRLVNSFPGSVDEAAVMISSGDISTLSSYLPVGLDDPGGSFEVSAGWNLSKMARPGAVSPAGAEVVGGAGDTVAIGNRNYQMRSVTAAITDGPVATTLAWGVGERLCVAVAVKYTDDVADGANDHPCRLRITDAPGAGYVDLVAYLDTIVAGDVCIYLFSACNVDDAEWETPSLTLYPYGLGVTGSGAKVSKYIGWVQATGTDNVPIVNALEVVPSTLTGW